MLRQRQYFFQSGITQKDVNLLDSGRVLRLGKNCMRFVSVLAADISFLQSVNIMNYSLLVSKFASTHDFKLIPVIR